MPEHSSESPATAHLARFLSRSGVASRRQADRMVLEGRVTVNGRPAKHPAMEIDPLHDHVKADGKPVPQAPPRVYFLLNKPRGYITSRDDPEGRRSVQELLPPLPFRIEPVGRLDFNTEGALLFTNDGGLAHRLTHPSFEVPRRYLAKVHRTPPESTLDKIRKGIRLEDGRTVPALCRVAESTDGGNAWIEITVTEGRNHLIRRLFAALGHPVSKLRRESFASISVRSLVRGDCRALTAEEVTRLQRMVQPGRTPSKRRSRKGWAKNKKKSASRSSRSKNVKRTRSTGGGRG